MQQKQSEMDAVSARLLELQAANEALQTALENAAQGANCLIEKLNAAEMSAPLPEIKLHINWHEPLVLEAWLVTKGAFVQEGQTILKVDGFDFSWKVSGFIKELLKQPGDLITQDDALCAILVPVDVHHRFHSRG
jgi:biotin carboxyl carrier protein